MKADIASTSVPIGAALALVPDHLLDAIGKIAMAVVLAALAGAVQFFLRAFLRRAFPKLRE